MHRVGHGNLGAVAGNQVEEGVSHHVLGIFQAIGLGGGGVGFAAVGIRRYCAICVRQRTVNGISGLQLMMIILLIFARLCIG